MAVDDLADQHEADSARRLMSLLKNVSDAEFRDIGLEALRRWRRRVLARDERARDPLMQFTGTVFEWNDVGIDIVKQLAERKGVAGPDTHNLKEPFIWDAALFRDWMSPFVEFIWWLVRAGLAVEHSYGYKGPPAQFPLQRVFPTSMRMTARGVRLLDASSDSDPLLPGFLDRIKDRCPGLPEGVLALLADARECLDRCLMRPAVILMGVAYELAIEEVIASLIAKGLIADKTLELEAKKRLDRVLDMIKDDAKLSLVIPGRDDRRRVQMAYDFADQLRLERNSAAHTRPAFDYEHREETEEFLVSAGRHLPGIWLLARDAPTT